MGFNSAFKGLKEEEVDRLLRRTRSGIVYEPVVSQTTGSMGLILNHL